MLEVACLTTLGMVKAWAPASAQADELDPTRQQLIKTISNAAIRYLDRPVERKERVELLSVDSPDRSKWWLRAWPVDLGQTFEVRHDTLRVFDAQSVLDPSSYVVADQGERGKLVFDSVSFGAGEDVLQVTYTGGMAADAGSGLDAAFAAAYPDIAGEVARRVHALATNRDDAGHKAIQGEAGSTAFDHALMGRDLMTVLARHKRYIH